MATVLTEGLDNAFRFERPENATVRAAYSLPTTGPYDTAAGRAALVATALKNGISQCVSINLTGGLDTHFGTELVHATNQRLGWNALGDLVSDLRATPHPTSGNFMDHTTIVCFSEFSRTPLINGSGGRDHQISSSCLIVGAGFQHNMVLGASGDGLTSGRINFENWARSTTRTASTSCRSTSWPPCWARRTSTTASRAWRPSRPCSRRRKLQPAGRPMSAAERER